MSTLLEPLPPLDFCSLTSESNRIISAHRRHFHGLSVLFLLPISFFSSIYFTLQSLLTSSQIHHHSQTLLRLYSPDTTNTTVFIILPLIYGFLTLFLSLSAVGSISFSVYQGFFGRPVKLISSILSLRRSFLPLLLTYLSSLLLQSLICFTFGGFLYLVVKGFEFLGFEIEQSSPKFCFVVAMLLVLMYLQVNWALASVIVVVESSWGLEALRRSTKLVKGVRGIPLSLMLLYGITGGSWLFTCWLFRDEFDGDLWSWYSWSFVVRTVVNAFLYMLIMLQYIVINTVLYMSCKAVHGEIAGEMAEEFAGEFVTLPFDDGKAHHIVSVIPTSELGLP